MSRPEAGVALGLALVFSLAGAAPAGAGLGPESGSGAAGSALHPLLARGGGGFGGGGRGGGGGRSGGGGGFGGGGGGVDRGRAPGGFGQAGPAFNRGNTLPAGGWSERTNLGGGGGPSLNRPANLPAIGPATLPANRVSGGGNRWSGNTVAVNRNWNRVTNVNAINVNAGWARPGWGVARPWNWGWYGGWSSPPWGWWAASTAVWGISTLASAAIINNAVSSAISASSPVIVVPNTGYELLFGTVQPQGSGGVTFVVVANGSQYQLSGDCNQGLLNGQQPQSAQEAELLNAACQVAFGSA